MKLRKPFALLLALSMLLALSACGPSTPPAATPGAAPAATATPSAGPAAIETFIVGTTTEITTANRSEYSFDVLSGTLSQLAPVWLDENGTYQPLLCDYTTADSKTWTLTVREGMKWHDGTDVTAEDIKFTLEYLDTQTDGGYASAYADLRVKDARTLELELEKPNPRQLSSLTTLRILPKHIYDGVADYTTVPNDQANIGCGPYRYVRFDPDAGVVVFSAVENYPDGVPAAKEVIVKLFDNEDTMYMALKAGELDTVYKYSGGVSPTVIKDLQSAGNLTLQSVSNTANSAALIFNNSAAPFDDLNIRKAVGAAIDYAAFRETFGSAYAVASTAGFIPKGSYGYIDTPVLERDLDAAKQYLTDAGCTDSDNDGILEYNGTKLSIPVMLRDDKPAHARYAELLKNNLAEVGIEVTLDVQEVANFRELTEKQRAQTAVITGLTPFGMDKNQGLAALYLWAENPMSYGQVSDSAYKALLDKADGAADMDAYKAVAGEIQNYYAQSLPAIALFWDSHVQAYQSKYDGFTVDGTFGLLNVQSWMGLHTK